MSMSANSEFAFAFVPACFFAFLQPTNTHGKGKGSEQLASKSTENTRTAAQGSSPQLERAIFDG